ncbi:hypothetical protein [Streptomyces sp. NBC_01171]|uniref:hypothetical protein n=1 Tax=Streptomyces sp. NBC_01171 TaxID=2903757 RepID=UPI00386FA6DD|nr:hypothetical protein OG448_29915 [Streptomyces sp. NBC_01171]
MRNDRWFVAIAAALLLAGCGGGGDTQIDTENGKAVALTKEQTRKTLPDGGAMTGWKASARPTTVKMNKLYRSAICPIKDKASCENSRFYGTSTFRRDDSAATATFLIVAYDSEQAAREAYDVLWNYYGKRTGQRARTFSLGPIGEKRDARIGPSGFHGEPSTITQARVGTTLLWTMTDSMDKDKNAVTEDSARDLATVLAKRARQAQNGDTPSATL